MDPKFLIIKMNGLIGQKVAEELDGRFSWTGTIFRRETKGALTMDITCEGDVQSVFQQVKPSCVIHCANFPGGVVACENDSSSARKFHVDATKAIGEQCLEYRSKFVYISTECVFDGKKEIYKEDDAPNPLNIYGRCKLESEEWLKKNLKDFLTIRTMSVFGWQPHTKTPNAVMKAFFSIRDKKKFPVAVYRHGTPTYAKNLAQSIVELVEDNAVGTYHVVGTTYISRYDWLKKTCEKLKWDSRYLIPEGEKSGDVPYPHRVHLSVEKFSSKFKTHVMSLDESLEALAKDVNSS